jgi:hypothetical protein
MAHLLLYSSYENGMGRKEKDEAAAAAARHRGVAWRHCTAAGVHKPNGFVICMFIGGGRNLHSRISCERGRFVFVRRKRHGMEHKVVETKYSKY